MIEPIAVATWQFGKQATAEAGRVLFQGGSPLDAVEAGIRLVELDPSEHSVGYGGVPNSDGIVQLDAAIMDGVTHDAGGVAALEGFRSPISVARRVMTRSRHVFLVGEGARAFARSQGFVEEPTLTNEMRAQWVAWRAKQDDKIPADSHDTIGLVAMDAKGDLAVGCSTSGVGYKEPGRVGDSPLLGSGLYVDNAVGGASATGLGEEIMKFCLSFLVVENMRHGADPDAACREAILRMIAKNAKYREIAAAVVALDRTGRHGGYSTTPGFSYGIWSPQTNEVRAVEIAH
ncbi:N(4)-(beta-N-acetylglucosaminyl)-L-asparaginase [Candidatus Poribacteria bacterium]|nr:N(4)-(beta-N-acetylglucosaminyl)-L-asparaginase [Candidatus Poribacteria bacterium]